MTTARYTVVVRRIEHIAFEVLADSPQQAGEIYLSDGDEVGGSTKSLEVIAIDLNDVPDANPQVPYRLGTPAISADGKVKATFEFIGEGNNGEYDETDPTDVPLLRIDIEVGPDYAKATDAEPTDDPAWFTPSDGSICTGVNMDTLGAVTGQVLLTYAAETTAQVLAYGRTSIKGQMDSLSHLPTMGV